MCLLSGYAPLSSPITFTLSTRNYYFLSLKPLRNIICIHTLRPRYLCFFVDFFVCKQDYTTITDYHKRWWKHVVWVREQPIQFWCGSRNCFSLSL